MDSETTAPARQTPADATAPDGGNEQGPQPQYQLVHVDALAAALAKLGMAADAAQLLATVREHELRLRPRPPPPQVVPVSLPNRERLKDPAVRAARKRMLDEVQAAFPNGPPTPIGLLLLEDLSKEKQG